MKINVLEEQKKHLSSKEKIKNGCKEKTVLAFDIYDETKLIGFAMLRKFEEGAFFLWNFAIDCNFQNMHYGTTALNELISLLTEKYNMNKMTTTYIAGNEHAKYIYEKVGFKETDVVIEPEYHEINMIYYCN